jgi:hypothetical protein
LSVLKGKSDDKIIIDKIIRVSDSYIIPVLIKNKTVKIYACVINDGFGGSCEEKVPAQEFTGFVSKVIVFKSGYIVAVGERAKTRLVFSKYGESDRKPADIRLDKLQITTIFDSVADGESIKILGTAIDGKRQYVWSGIVVMADDGSVFLKYNKLMEFSGIVSASYIESTPREPRIQIVERNAVTSKPTIRIFDLNKVEKPILEVAASDYRGDKKSNYATICDGKLIEGELIVNKSPYKSQINLSVIDPRSKLPAGALEEIDFGSSVITSFAIYPSTESVFLAVNFSRVNPVLRDGGYYSWYGYSVIESSIESVCQN